MSVPPIGVEARRAVLRQLEGDAVGIRRQIEAFLRDDDWRVRKDAAALAARHLESASLAKLLAASVLQGDDVGLRNAAIEALVTAGTGPSATDEARRDVHAALGEAEKRAPHTALKFLCAAWVGAGSLGLSRLADHARDPDPTTAVAAVEALARIAGTAAERELEAVAFSQGHDVVRLAAVEGLVALRSRVPAAKTSALFAAPYFARPVLALLGHSADPAAIEPLIAHLASPRLAADAARALADLLTVRELHEPTARALVGLPEPVRSSLLALTSEERDDPPTARAALTLLLLARDLRALGNLARFGAREELGRPLMDATLRLGPEAARGLVELLPELDPPSTAWAIEVAVELLEGSRDAALLARVRAALREALVRGGEAVQVAALRGLELFGEPEDAARLVALGARGTGNVAAAATDAIAALANSSPEAALSALQQEAEEAPLAWSKAVVALPRRLAIEKVSEAAVAAEPSVRRAAIEALVHLGGDDAADLAAIALADEDEAVRHAAVRSLAQLASSGAASERARAALDMALRAPEAQLRAAAVRAATEHDLPLDAMALELALDPSPEVEAALFRALAQPGSRSVSEAQRAQLVGPLTLATTHEDDEVVKAALAALVAGRADAAADALVHALTHRAWDVRLDAARLIGTLLAEVPAARSDALRRALALRRTVEDDDLVREAIDGALSSFWASGSWPPGGEA